MTDLPVKATTGKINRKAVAAQLTPVRSDWHVRAGAARRQSDDCPARRRSLVHGAESGRTKVAWEGQVGTGSKLARALRHHDVDPVNY